MGIPDNTKQTASNAVAGMGNWFAVFVSPGGGVNGANEVSGGNYGRRQGVWTPGTDGTNSSNTVNIPLPEGTYTEGGVFSAQTGGTFVGSDVFAGGSVYVQGFGASIDLNGYIRVPA